MAKINKEIQITAKAEHSQVEKLNQKLKQTETRAKKLSPALKAVGVSFISFAAAALKATQSSVALASQIKDMADRAGMGTTQMQVLGRVAEDSGSSMEEMNKAVLKLTKSAQDAAQGNKQLADRFARLGIDVEKFKALSPEKQMERLGIAVASTTDKQATMAEVMALVGQDAGPKLIESLKKLGTEGYDALAEKAEKSGQVLSEKAIQNLDRAGTVFKNIWHQLKVATAEAVGAVFELTDKIDSKLKAAEKKAAERAREKYGEDNFLTSAMHQSEAAEKIAAGDLEGAKKSLEAAKIWVSAAKERAAAGKLNLGRDMGHIGIEGNGLFFGSAPPLPSPADTGKRQEELEAQLAKAEEFALKKQKELEDAMKRAAQAAMEAEVDVFFADIDAAEKQIIQRRLKAEADARKALETEAARAMESVAQFNFDKLAPSQQLRQQTEAFFTRVEELSREGLITQEQLAEAAQMYREELARADRLLNEETYGEQIKAAAEATKQLLRFEEEKLTQKQRALAEAESFHARVEELYNAERMSAEQLEAALNRVNEARAELAEETAWENLGQSLKNVHEALGELDKTVETQLSSTLKDFVETGTADMKKLGQSIINEVIQAMLKALVLKPLLTGIGNMFGGAGGGAVGGIFGGIGKGLGLPSIPGRASGGPVKGRSPYLVGERGPELFIPPASGTIIDANKTAAALAGDTATGGDTGPQNVYQIDARGADAGAVQRLEAALLKLAGPGVVEKRARAAEADRARRG